MGMHLWVGVYMNTFLSFYFGSTFGFYERVTFLLDRNGRVAKVYPSVDPAVHASQVLADATALR